MEFNIGERVRIKSYDKLPEELKNRGVAKVAGEEGVIVDKLHSEQRGCIVYKIHLEGYERPSKAEFVEGSFDLIKEVEYVYEFENLENLVVARLYEINCGVKTEVAKGHGHIFHEGVIGIAQASSYALKKIYEKINGGNL